MNFFKLTGSLAACAALLSLAACSSTDEPAPAPQDKGNVTISVKLPNNFSSRDFSDGNSAKTLYYSVYSTTDPETPLEICPDGKGGYTTTGTATFPQNALETTVNLELANTIGYNVVFWAQNDAAPYTFSAQGCNVTIDYNQLDVNNDNLDAFTQRINIAANRPDGPIYREVSLRRPFAQVNIGTDDIEKAKKAGLTIDNVTVKTQTGTKLNLFTDEVSDFQTVTYKAAAIPAASQPFPVNGFSYLTMNYLLVPEKENINVELYINPQGSDPKPFREFTNVPVQRNYRTNIFGTLLTVMGTFNVIIEPNFEGSYNPMWNGNPTIVLNDNEVIISGRQVREGLTVKGNGTLVINNSSIVSDADGVPAITIAEGSNVAIIAEGSSIVTGARNAEAIRVEEGASLEMKGNTMVLKGNAGKEFSTVNPDYSNTSDASFNGTGGSAIGNSDPGKNVGSIYIHDFKNLTALGYGLNAYGIGGTNANITITNSHIAEVRGGFANSDFLADTKYGKSEPEGGAAIGTSGKGYVTLTGTTIDKARGGSKAAAIGARFWASADITISDCTLRDIVGGNASAGIGGSRCSDNGTLAISINIDNSDIEVRGGQFGAGIGSGYDTYCKANNPDGAFITITGNSKIAAIGGKYAAGIGTGFHNAGLSGEIAASVDTSGTAAGTPDFYKAEYTTAQAIGYGVIDANREGKDLQITFTVGGKLIAAPF